MPRSRRLPPGGTFFVPTKNDHDYNKCEWYDRTQNACYSPMNCFLKDRLHCAATGCATCAGMDPPLRLIGGTSCPNITSQN